MTYKRLDRKYFELIDTNPLPQSLAGNRPVQSVLVWSTGKMIRLVVRCKVAHTVNVHLNKLASDWHSTEIITKNSATYLDTSVLLGHRKAMAGTRFIQRHVLNYEILFSGGP